MQQSLRLSRVVLTGAALAVLALACDSVLDIDDPKMRPGDAGASGAPDDTGGTSSGGSATPKGGDAGAPPVDVGGAGTGNEAGGAGAGGQAGSGEPHECERDEIRCGGDTEKTPQICDETFHFVFNNLEADADCPVLCDAGKCTECVSDEKRCSVCDEADTTCSTNQPQTCIDGHWQDDEETCAQYCDAGICKAASSCDVANKARTTCTGNESCCESLLIPGGTFKRDFDNVDFADDSFPAEVSPFYLDKFEVTVGRMRQFVEAFEQEKKKLKDGDGKSTHISGDTGWDTSYELPVDKAALITQLKCTGTTWSDTIFDNNDLPMNCVNFNVAYAFCIWDGGRLPTNLEWNFAASGGDEQRVYPWKAPESGPAISSDYANYDNTNPGPIAVGLKPLGNARWGQADLAGNLLEWALDYFGDYPAVCKDCFNGTAGLERVLRGGGYVQDEFLQVSSYPTSNDPTEARSYFGFRCARDLE
jgi:sulfatase modifying factor 1